MSKVLQNGESLSEEELRDLRSCVECRACEKVCPSKMPYLDLLNSTREKSPDNPTSPLVRGLLFSTAKQNRLRQLFRMLRVYQKTGFQSFIDASGLLKVTKFERLHRMLPKLSSYQKFEAYYPSLTATQGSVGLFTGCLTDVMQNSVLHAAIKVLTHLGYDVHIPRRQQCCGAIHANNGDADTAESLAAENISTFNALDIDAILFTASACGTSLMRYANSPLDEQMQNLSGFESKLIDVNEFIADADWPERLKMRPLKKRVFVHEPCSQQYPAAAHKSAYEFLQSIPSVELEPLPENNICCGAGGTYMLTHPEASEKIRDIKLEHLKEGQAEILVTSNIGCALHLAAGIKGDGLEVEVLHPVELLARHIAL